MKLKPKYTKILNKKSDVQLIFPKDFLPIYKKSDSIKLYYEGIKKSNNLHTDNFPKSMRFFSLIQNIEYILNKKKVYDFVECGCWKGHSSYIISKLIKNNKKKINFHIFDSFEGLSNSTTEDDIYHRKKNKDKAKIQSYFKSDQFFVEKKVLKEFNFVKTYKGWIPERFKDLKVNKFSFVHLDVDLYQPTIESLKFFYPKLAKGGIIICDDFNVTGFPGATKAWNEYFKNKDYNFFHKNPLGGCFIIK